MLISDFGLCRRIEFDQSSYSETGGATGAETSGWKAPEILHGEVKADETITDGDTDAATTTSGLRSGQGGRRCG